MGAVNARVSVRAARFCQRKRLWLGGALAVVAAVTAVAIPIATAADPTAGQYQQTNLISDIPGVARITDPNLVNPWGQAASASSPLWVADNGSDVSTLYSGGVSGSIPQIVSLTVNIPGGAPTGVVFNSTTGFVVTTATGSAAANFIFDSEAGVLSAWSGAVSGTNADVEFSNKHYVYKGLALASLDGESFLYAANFSKARIDVFDDHFRRVIFPHAFKDKQIPAGFAPFDVQLLDGDLFVSYAKQDAAERDDVAGPGYAVTDTAGLETVLAQIIGKAVSCTIPLTGVSGNLDKVAVSAKDASGNTIEIMQDATNGWSYTDANKTAIILNGDACNNLKSVTYTGFQFIYTCATGIIMIG